MLHSVIYSEKFLTKRTGQSHLSKTVTDKHETFYDG